MCHKRRLSLWAKKICATREDCLFGQKKFVPQEKTVSLGKKNLYKNPVPDMARGGTVEKLEKLGENLKKNRLEYYK